MDKIEKNITKFQKIMNRQQEKLNQARSEWPTLEADVMTIASAYDAYYQNHIFSFPFIFHTSSTVHGFNANNKQIKTTVTKRYNFNSVSVSLGSSSLGIGYESETTDLQTKKNLKVWVQK
jgi:hypothetical protein